jgi:hypothetical protein
VVGPFDTAERANVSNDHRDGRVARARFDRRRSICRLCSVLGQPAARDAAMRRAGAYVAAGADGIFAPAPRGDPGLVEIRLGALLEAADHDQAGDEYRHHAQEQGKLGGPDLDLAAQHKEDLPDHGHQPDDDERLGHQPV